MKNLHRLALAVVFLIAALVSTTSISTAHRLEISNFERGFRLTWSSLEFRTGAGTVRCAVTLEGSLSSRTIAKTAGGKIGSLIRGSTSACSGGTASVERETLPWEIQYASFSGTLPNITEFTMDYAEAGLEIKPTGGAECHTKGEVPFLVPAVIAIAVTLWSASRANERSSIPITGEALCAFAGELTLAGTGNTPTVIGGTAQPTLRLVM